MKDSRPLVQYVYEMQVYLNKIRTSISSIDTDLFKSLHSESSVRLVDDPLHNKYINYYYNLMDSDTTPVYYPSQVYHFYMMRRGVVLENHLIQGEEIPPCAMLIYWPDEAVSDSLLSICSQISTRQPVSDLRMEYVTCNSLEAPRLIKPRTVVLDDCKFKDDFITKLLRQLIECHCGETLQVLDLRWMDLRPFQSLLDELLEDLVAHHEAGLAQRMLRLWQWLTGRGNRKAGLARRKLWLLLGGSMKHRTNLSEEFVKKWRNRCEKVDSTDCMIGDDWIKPSVLSLKPFIPTISNSL